MDTVRASRDGHEFHEAWAARQALKLVMPTDDFVGIAVEGLSPSDQKTASAKTVEIADLALYYGVKPEFKFASSIVILQLKYSKASENEPFRAYDAKKTLTKFSDAYVSHKKNYGEKNVEKKLTFELLTNRPILPELNEAISGLASGTSLKGVAEEQAIQFVTACGLNGTELSEFAKKVTITGLAGNLTQNKQHLSRIVVDWSVAPDAMARARLGKLKELIRDKAGLAGEGKNVVTRIDVLAALELQGPEDLFPCPASFPVVGQVVTRQQLNDVANKIPALTKPLLIHADGGVGKTVFFQSLSKMLSDTHEVVLFDCFGGGNYRVPEDARHLPKRGLIHIINSLACKGLSDPLLPYDGSIDDVVRAFRLRLDQAVATLRRGAPEKQILLFLDAIDNAAEHAKDKNEPSFPTLLLESFHHGGPVNGVQLILSCRTYRRDISRGSIPRAACEEIELKPFNHAEAEKYLRDRIPTVTNTEIQVAYSRSLGNPRILEHLASDRGLLDSSEINNVIELDDLLRERIQLALSKALKRGYKEPAINAFLAGLSVLPLPVPLDEYAEAHGMDLSAVRSFAADLAPLLEQTKYGLMFRDEPTETLLREDYAAKVGTLKTLADNLFEKQGTSVYAARSLPGLLQKIDDGELLFKLAFEDRFPPAITSIVGKQNIRYARLKAAVLHSVQKENYDRLVRLLVELSMLAAVNQRGTNYVLDNPDLVIASHDIDATRRLFEIRTQWPGTRHARLAIASVLSGDQSDALRHAVKANDWIRHFYEQNDEYRRERGGPERLDIASIPVCLLAESRGRDAANLMKGWRDWYAFEVAEHIFTLLNQAQAMKTISTEKVSEFLHELKSKPGMLSAALSFLDLDDAMCRSLINYLAKACGKQKTFEVNKNFNRENSYQIHDGLLKVATLAVAMEMHAEALTIALTISLERPRLWSFADRFSNKDAFSFITYTAIRGAIKRQPIVAQDILPQELVDIGARIENSLTGEAFRKALKVELEAYYKTQQELSGEKQQVSYETKKENERFIDERLEPLLEFVQSLTVMLSSVIGKGDKQFQDLLNVWMKLRKKREHYSDLNGTNNFFDKLGIHFLIFVLWSRNDLKAASVEAFVKKVSEDDVAVVSTLIDIISILSKRADLQELAGKTAIKAKTLIERENEVESRASLFAQLSRAILPASFDEASSYFCAGLEQMDAIGSGDYQFTNELLLFAAELKGDELEESDFHTLSNICELNMPEEEEKFPWLAFARGLSRTSGLKMLAKLGRWADRDKVSLDYTLLPYLTALIEYDKIDPAIALALLRISSPAELYVCGTEQLAEVIVKKRYANSKELVSELILQFEQNHPGVFMPSTQATLSKIAEREIGKDSEQSIYLSVAAPKFKILQDENNDHYNYRGTSAPNISEAADEIKEKNRQTLKAIVDKTSPNDETSMSRAIDEMNGIQNIFDLKGEFLDSLRIKIRFADRSKYVQIIARLEALGIYTKLRELRACKDLWGGSSASINETFQKIGVLLVRINAENFVSNNYLSGSNLKEVSELTGIPMALLARELVAIFAASDSHYPASIWMGLAAIISEKTKAGEGQAALKRLLNSSSAKLASAVADRAWKEGLYPKGGQTETAAGLVWLTLGSPAAEGRWRASHSITCLARFGKWEVIDAIVGKFHSTDAHPYQAAELPFFFLHARLWLIIALARLAIDHPRNVEKYAEMLKVVALNKEMPHVLLRHFASKTLLACVDCGSHVLSRAEVDALMKVNQPFFPQIKTEKYAHDLIYQSRPDSIPKQQPEFHLDYDFNKTDVASLCNMFDKPGWETSDAITAQVRKFDHKITSMYESGGRATSHQSHLGGMNSRIHTYGQQLGCHALYLVAGEFLTKYPIILRPYQEEDSWSDWLNHELLTRDDGLWLSDGIDRIPIDAQLNLKEKGKKDIVLTGDSAKLLTLLNIELHIAQELVVAGDWRSADDVHIHISSALVPTKDATKVAFKLSKKQPFDMWLPSVEYDDETENSISRKEPYKPWIVWPYSEAKLDEKDPLGAIAAARKLHFTKAVNVASQIKAEDPFKRTWTLSNGKIAARSEAWVSHRVRGQDESESGRRLVCSSKLLRDVLQKESTELLVLIKLTHYKPGYSGHGSKYWHTTAVVRVNQSLDFEYYSGAANKLYEMKY